MVSLPASSQTCGAVVGLALLVGSGGLVLRELETRDSRPAVHGEVLVWARPDIAEDVAATYDGVFHGTVYYTVLESAFMDGSGFDLTPITKAGLQERKFARDFLRAVEVEGFGRMKTAVN